MADRHADGRIDVVVCCCLRLTFLVTLAWTLSMDLFLCLLAGRAIILPRSASK